VSSSLADFFFLLNQLALIGTFRHPFRTDAELDSFALFVRKVIVRAA
jgi:hypothetical protein